jgi:hypothetical protein
MVRQVALLLLQLQTQVVDAVVDILLLVVI